MWLQEVAGFSRGTTVCTSGWGGCTQARSTAQDVDDDVQALDDAIQQRLSVIGGILVAQVVVGPGDDDLHSIAGIIGGHSCV